MKVLTAASIVLVGLLLILLASSVPWLVSSHYQDLVRNYKEILREKDASYWELVNRRQTTDLHCEDQCRRQMESNTHHFSTVISACEDRLKTLLQTDVQSTQMREQSHREMWSTFKSQLVVEHTQTAALQCQKHCQMLQDELKACNSSQIGLRLKNRHLTEQERRQRHLIITKQKQLKQCEADRETVTSTGLYWMINLFIVLLITAVVQGRVRNGAQSILQTTTDIKQPDIDKIISPLQDTEIEKLLEELAEVKNQRKAESIELREQLEAAESKLSAMSSDLEKERKKTTALTQHLQDKDKQILKLTKEKEYIKNQYHDIAKTLEAQLAMKSQQLVKIKGVAEREKFEEIKKLEKELNASYEHATQADGQLREQKESNKMLQKQVKAQDQRIRSINEQLLLSEKKLKGKETKIKILKLEIQRETKITRNAKKEGEAATEKYLELKRDLADLEAAVTQKDIELEQQLDRRGRALKGQSLLEDRVKKLEQQLQEMSHQSSKAAQKKHKPEADKEREDLRLEVYREFEIEYNRHEAKTHSQITSLTELIGALKTETKEKQRELEKLRNQNRRLQELLERDHAQTKREEAGERTYRVQLDFALTPPVASTQ